MKKTLAVLLAFVMIFLFAACNKTAETALVIEGVEINSEIFSYYLSKVVSRPADYGLEANASKDELKEAAIDECKRYLFSNTSFIEKGLSLTASDKVEISQTVNDYWLRFENHYNEIGVSKQTLTKVITASVYKDALFSAEYDKGTGNAASEKILQDYFYENYISFRSVCIYYTAADGKTNMTELEKVQLLEAVNSIAAEPGEDAEAFSQTVQNAGYTLSASSVLKRDSGTYPDGFYEKVEEQAENTVQVITYDECVFMVWKENLKDKGESVYANYRSACINDLYFEEYENTVSEKLDSYSVEEKSIVNKMI